MSQVQKSMVRGSRALGFVALLSLGAACGAKGAATAPTTADEAPAAPAVPWASMSFDQRADHMQSVVVPKMQPVFAELDAKEFAKLECTHCHGADARKRQFAMPNPDIEALDASDGFAAAKAEYPAVMELMMQKVVPSMAEALGVEPFDPATGKGLGCFNCHPKAGDG